MDALLVLHELSEAEVRVLGPRRRSAARRAARLVAAPENELELRPEQDDERQPERHPLLQRVDEQPREHEPEGGQPDDELHAAAADHTATVRPRQPG